MTNVTMEEPAQNVKDRPTLEKKEKEPKAKVKKKPKFPKRKDVRIAVIGNVDSGKSTIIGVLTSGEKDDGRGLARAKVLRHSHEQANGRTSACAQHIFGYSEGGDRIYNPVAVSAPPQRKPRPGLT